MDLTTRISASTPNKGDTMTSTITTQRSAFYDPVVPAIVVDQLTITDPTALAEARHWTGGTRGPAADNQELVDADLSAFIGQAVSIGAHAISSAGGVQESVTINALINEVEERTTAASAEAAKATASAVGDASTVMKETITAVQQTIKDAGQVARTEFATNVESARKSLHAEITRLLGGEDPELVTRLVPVLDKFATNLDQVSTRRTDELFTKAAKQLDPDDPASPMAKQSREMQRHQADLKSALEKANQQLSSKVDELAKAFQIAHSAEDATAALLSRTTLKGGRYEEQICAVMQDIADGLGDEFGYTGDTAGRIPRCKKGDGLLKITGGDSAVVLEMTDSHRSDWGDYLATAEDNRGAQASLGLVPRAELLNGTAIKCLGPRRILMAFDPAADDPALLRTVVQLLRLGAVAASSRLGSDEIQTAQEKINEALALTEKLAGIQSLAGTIRNSANKISNDSGSLQQTLQRLLTEAGTALASAAPASAAEAE